MADGLLQRRSERGSALGCSKRQRLYLGHRKPEVLSKLRSKSVQGRAQVFVELLPPVQPLAPPPQGSFYLDPKVKVRGISIDPQCSASPNIYWIIEARFLDSSRPGMSR